MDEYVSRRTAVSDALPDAVAVIPSAVTRLRNGDSDWRFRQNSDFSYLTGLNEPEAVLVIAPARPFERATLFLRPRDRAAELWTGHRLGVERAADTLAVDAAYPIEEFDQRLPGLLAKSSRLMYALGADEAFDRRVMLAVARARRQTVAANGPTPHTIVDPGTILHELRLRKSEAEIATLRRAGAITRLGHIAGMRATRPGAAEYEVQAAIEYAYRMAGSQEPAYTSIVASGDNATILHYTDNRDRLADGALLLVDSAAELDNYATDVTRTWPVNGRFSAEQRAVYEIVLAAPFSARPRVPTC